MFRIFLLLALVSLSFGQESSGPKKNMLGVFLKTGQEDQNSGISYLRRILPGKYVGLEYESLDFKGNAFYLKYQIRHEQAVVAEKITLEPQYGTSFGGGKRPFNGSDEDKLWFYRTAFHIGGTFKFTPIQKLNFYADLEPYMLITPVDKGVAGHTDTFETGVIFKGGFYFLF